MKSLKRIIVLDCQWNHANAMNSHVSLSNLKRLKIGTYSTTFWRYQRTGDSCLATIEAIYYFFKEYHKAAGKEYRGEYDNLLFYYKFFHDLIRNVRKDGSVMVLVFKLSNPFLLFIFCS